jgi:hypothetical protein
MTKLKTLKDIFEEENWDCEIHDEANPINFQDKLKQEAIKWVKAMSDDDDITSWMDFFNLTEEDLKEAK